MKIKFAAAFALAALVILASAGFVKDTWGCRDWDRERYEFHETFNSDLAGIDKVSIYNVNGSITVTTWAENKVNIEISERVKADSNSEAAAIAEEIKWVGKREGSNLVIKADYGRYEDDEKRHSKYASELEVKLPNRLAIHLDTVNGSISAPLMTGDIDLDTTNGDINAEGTNGDAKLDTTNGTITVGKVGGHVEADTTNGAIKLMSVGGAIKADTTNGSIYAVIPGALAGDVTLDTTNGSIELVVGAGSNCEIKADVSNGKVRDYLPAGRFKGDYNKRQTYLRGTLGSGGYMVTLDTTNGSITIKGQ
jgi:DUF4097 and DUF4098 domain-containing protein YvlB